MKLIIIISLVALVAVMAEERGKSRAVPNYKTGSVSYEPQYETTTYTAPAYITTPTPYKVTTEASYKEEPVIYRKYSTPSRPSYTTPEPYAAETTPYTPYSKSTYEPTYSTLASTYPTEEKFYTKPATYEAVSYSSKPAYTEPSSSAPTYTTKTPQRYSAPAYNKKESYDYKPMPYKFSWAVKDEPSYNDYSHQQESDGKVTTGSYRVLLPDGRTQVVTYKADEYGYVADVKYEGEAKYPEYKPAYKPSYTKPAYREPTYAKPAYPTEEAKYQEENKYADDYKTINYSSTKAPTEYTTAKNVEYNTKPTYAATPAYSPKSYEAQAYTTPSYQAPKY